jgi:hypothetical protein
VRCALRVLFFRCMQRFFRSGIALRDHMPESSHPASKRALWVTICFLFLACSICSAQCVWLGTNNVHPRSATRRRSDPQTILTILGSAQKWGKFAFLHSLPSNVMSNFPSGTFLGTTTGCDRHFQFLMNLTSKDERRLQYHYLEHSILL